ALVALTMVLAGCATGSDQAAWLEPVPSPTGPPPPPPFTGWSNPALVGKPFGKTVAGLLTFRGNPTRTFFGTGPAVRANPAVVWAFPKDGNMCGLTSTVKDRFDEWCGNGWTGQPAVIERNDRTWVITGGYDHNIHFIDAATGDRIIPDFVTG